MNKTIKPTFPNKTISRRIVPIVVGSAGSVRPGRCQPPKRRAVRKLIVTTWVYSARKKSTNLIPLYSVWNPPTNSCSHSDKSNGKRFDSASALVKKIRPASGCHHMFHENQPAV